MSDPVDLVIADLEKLSEDDDCKVCDLHAKVRAWEPFVRRAFELMNDPDGGKELEDYLMSALDIPENLRP